MHIFSHSARWESLNCLAKYVNQIVTHIWDFLLYLEDTKLNFSVEKVFTYLVTLFPSSLQIIFQIYTLCPVFCSQRAFIHCSYTSWFLLPLPQPPDYLYVFTCFTVMAPEEVLWSISSIIHVLNSLNTWMALSAIIVLLSILRSI